MDSKPPIGGFFELETPYAEPAIHQDAIALSTGRSCLLAILKHVKPKRCFLPHYTCNATIEPFIQCGIATQFYKINDRLEPDSKPSLEAGDCFLLTNYWGLQQELVKEYAAEYGSRLIIDNTHDFFTGHRHPDSWSFTSARKYFGVPDGAFLYIPSNCLPDDVVSQETERFQHISLQHSVNRMRRQQQEAFRQYQAYEQSLPCDLHRISKYSMAILSLVDYESAAKKRVENYRTLADHLGATNTLQFEFTGDSPPFAYPYLPKMALEKSKLYAENIFPPSLWPDVLSREGMVCEVAKHLAQELLPLPIDHRYGPAEMNRIIETMKQLES